MLSVARYRLFYVKSSGLLEAGGCAPHIPLPPSRSWFATACSSTGLPGFPQAVLIWPTIFPETPCDLASLSWTSDPGELLEYDWDTFQANPAKFRIGALRANDGRQVYWERGNIKTQKDYLTRIQASSTMPVFMPPVRIDGKAYVYVPTGYTVRNQEHLGAKIQRSYGEATGQIRSEMPATGEFLGLA